MSSAGREQIDSPPWDYPVPPTRPRTAVGVVTYGRREIDVVARGVEEFVLKQGGCLKRDVSAALPYPKDLTRLAYRHLHESRRVLVCGTALKPGPNASHRTSPGALRMPPLLHVRTRVGVGHQPEISATRSGTPAARHPSDVCRPQLNPSKVRRARLLSGLNKGHAAAKAGLSRLAYYRWENEAAGPVKTFDFYRATVLAECLGVSIDDLIDAQGPAQGRLVPPAPAAAPSELRGHDRMLTVVDMRLKGSTVEAIAQTFRISAGRVSQICDRAAQEGHLLPRSEICVDDVERIKAMSAAGRSAEEIALHQRIPLHYVRQILAERPPADASTGFEFLQSRIPTWPASVADIAHVLYGKADTPTKMVATSRLLYWVNKGRIRRLRRGVYDLVRTPDTTVLTEVEPTKRPTLEEVLGDNLWPTIIGLRPKRKLGPAAQNLVDRNNYHWLKANLARWQDQQERQAS